MSVRYACSHLDTPAPPLPPTYPSSHSSFFPIEQLYFCEECDALRCDLCVGVEVASYFCPNCLFDVPGANVRGDKNRWVSSCCGISFCIDWDRNVDARDHVSRVLNVHLVYQYKRLIHLLTMVESLDMKRKQHHLLDLCIFSFVPGVGGRVNRLVGRLKNPPVLPVRPLSFYYDSDLDTIEMNS